LRRYKEVEHILGKRMFEDGTLEYKVRAQLNIPNLCRRRRRRGNLSHSLSLARSLSVEVPFLKRAERETLPRV